MQPGGQNPDPNAIAHCQSNPWPNPYPDGSTYCQSNPRPNPYPDGSTYCQSNPHAYPNSYTYPCFNSYPGSGPRL